MEELQILEEIKVYYIQAASFPDKVLEAHQQLHQLISFNPTRRYFGLSNPDKTGKIIYKAAAEELVEGELSKHGLETYTIPAGMFAAITIKNFREDISSIGKSFQQLIIHPQIDPN